jgi:hypothetical protein
VRVHELADDGGAQARLADAALARYGYDFGLRFVFFHSVPSRRMPIRRIGIHDTR